MFNRGDVVRQTDTGWIGVVEYMEKIQAQDGATDYGKVIWFEGRNAPSSGGYHFTLATHPFIEKIDGYEFEAALALGDTITAQKIYRAERQRTEAWQEHFQPLIDQYGAAQMAWIAGSIAAMVATGQFTPEDAIRHWQRPQAVVYGEPIFYGKSFAPEWVKDLQDRFVTEFPRLIRQKLLWPPPKWWVEGMRLVSTRQQLDALTGGLSDAEWQEILDYCQDVAFDSADLDVFWKELAMWETHAKHVGGSKALMFDILRRAKGNG